MGFRFGISGLGPGSIVKAQAGGPTLKSRNTKLYIVAGTANERRLYCYGPPD